jgi:hypothetical protein
MKMFLIFERNSLKVGFFEAKDYTSTLLLSTGFSVLAL